MSDGMDIYRAYLSAQKLAEGLLAAHHDKAGRKHHLTYAAKEILETRDRIEIAVTSITSASAPPDAPS